jgi:hypothetical protein
MRKSKVERLTKADFDILYEALSAWVSAEAIEVLKKGILSAQKNREEDEDVLKSKLNNLQEKMEESIKKRQEIATITKYKLIMLKNSMQL